MKKINRFIKIDFVKGVILSGYVLIILNGCDPHQTKKEYYNDGKLKSIIVYKDGKKDGEYKTYYNNGKIEISSTWIEGKLNGEAINYYENGKIELKRNYK